MKRSKTLAAGLLMVGASALWAGPKRHIDNNWSIQVGAIESGEVNVEPAFKLAIYENLVKELTKANQFRQVFRDGDRNATSVKDMLILKTIVESYTPGSETKRAVTTVAGATKLNVLAQLCTQDGHVVVEHSVNGEVRFFGGNLRATQNLAHNMAQAIKKSTLPEPTTVE